MKSYLRVFLPAFLLLGACATRNAPSAAPTPVPRGPEVHAVFAGNTPCSAQARPLPQVPADSDCDQMIWSITFYQDPQTQRPTTYSLKTAYGVSKQGTNDLVGGGTPIAMDETWTITAGTKSDPDAAVYQINPDDPGTTVSFLRVSENLIHVLSSDKTMLVGNGAWSYTLNRMDNQSPAHVDQTDSPPEPPTRPPVPPVPEGSSVFGVFDGRTPCHAVVIEFTGNEPYPGCIKIKWRLTLYQDQASRAPSTYLYMGTSGFREGTWSIIEGMDGDTEAVIYQLQVRDSQQPVSFLLVDENHLFLMDRDMNLLVGNDLFSYTFSRVHPGEP